MQTRRKKSRDKAMPDLTPMIDVTFQLLIFFILCTRFKDTERNFLTELPDDEGSLSLRYDIPKEQLTIYCNWDEDTGANSYVVAIGARGRKPVENTYARLTDVVIFPNDGNAAIAQKKERYRVMFENLVSTAESYIRNSGARIEKIEIAFAKDSRQGASSGTAPWMFVSGAIDAAAKVNKARPDGDKLPVTFKFVDALESYSR